jgi:hypothetical protein
VKREGAPKDAPEATAAKQQTWGHLSVAGRQPLQLSLPLESPACGRRLHPAEADLRFTVNTMDRARPHWWLLTEAGKAQRQFLEAAGWWAA